MRLKNMYFTCRKYQDYINSFALTEIKSSNSITRYEIPEYHDFAEAINDLYVIGCLRTTLENLTKSMGNSLTGTNKEIVEISNSNDFTRTLKNLQSKINTIIDLGDSVGFSEITYGFDVKMPPDLTLSEMANCLADMDKVFTQCPILNVDGERIEFSNVDVGSTWFEFLTIASGTYIILNNLADFVDKCVVIASHIKSTRMYSETAKTLTLENEFLKSLTDNFKTVQDALVEKVTNELSSEHDITDPETKERLSYSIKLLSEWQSRGLEIYSSIDAPKEIQVLFPSVEKQQSLKENEPKFLNSGDNDAE